jgi:hypothetical protein
LVTPVSDAETDEMEEHLRAFATSSDAKPRFKCFTASWTS